MLLVHLLGSSGHRLKTFVANGYGIAGSKRWFYYFFSSSYTQLFKYSIVS